MHGGPSPGESERTLGEDAPPAAEDLQQRGHHARAEAARLLREAQRAPPPQGSRASEDHPPRSEGRGAHGRLAAQLGEPSARIWGESPDAQRAPGRRPSMSADAQGRSGAGTRALLTALFVASGAVGLAYEVAWTRGLLRLLGSTAVASALVLAAFVGGLGLGARW